MATGTTAEQIIDVVTPAAGESVSEGTILEWHVKVGDFIKVNDTIVEISTDKVDLELPSPGSGTVTEILIDEGETVTVGQVIARLAVGDAPAGDGAAGVAQEPPAPAPDTGQPSAPDTAQPSAPDTGQQSAVSPPQTASHPETPPATGPAQDARAQARAQRGRPQGVVHAPDRLRDRARGHRDAGDGRSLRRGRRTAISRARRPGQPRAGGGRGEAGWLAYADGPRDRRRRTHAVR